MEEIKKILDKCKFERTYNVSFTQMQEIEKIAKEHNIELSGESILSDDIYMAYSVTDVNNVKFVISVMLKDYIREKLHSFEKYCNVPIIDEDFYDEIKKYKRGNTIYSETPICGKGEYSTYGIDIDKVKYVFCIKNVPLKPW